MSSKPQILFLSHGGGPMPLLGDAGHKEMVDCLKSIASLLRKPRCFSTELSKKFVLSNRFIALNFLQRGRV